MIVLVVIIVSNNSKANNNGKKNNVILASPTISDKALAYILSLQNVTKRINHNKDDTDNDEEEE